MHIHIHDNGLDDRIFLLYTTDSAFGVQSARSALVSLLMDKGLTDAEVIEQCRAVLDIAAETSLATKQICIAPPKRDSSSLSDSGESTEDLDPSDFEWDIDNPPF